MSSRAFLVVDPDDTEFFHRHGEHAEVLGWDLDGLDSAMLAAVSGRNVFIMPPSPLVDEAYVACSVLRRAAERLSVSASSVSVLPTLWESPDHGVSEALSVQAWMSSQEGPPTRPHSDGGSLEVLDASTLASREIPRREWLVEGIMPMGSVTELDGDGGAGKSLLALQLAACIVGRTPFLDLATRQGPVLFLSAEDDTDELHRRLNDICRALRLSLSDLSGLSLLARAGLDSLLATTGPARSGALEATDLFRQLEALIAVKRPVALVLDTRADLFGGNEIDRSHARQFLTLLRGIATRYGCAIILLSHPSLVGMREGRGGSGSTGWRNSVRSAISLGRPSGADKRDPNLRILEVKKSNYGPVGERTRLRWHEGAFQPDRHPEKVPVVTDTLSEADEKFLLLMKVYADKGKQVSAAPGRNSAPALFAEDPLGCGVSNAGYRAAMVRLLRAGVIIERQVGTKSRPKAVIEIVATGGKDDLPH